MILLKRGDYMIKKKIEIMLKNEETRLKKLQSALKTLPKGKLYVRKRNGKIYYSFYKDGKEHWITKDKALIDKYHVKESLENSIATALESHSLLNELLSKLGDNRYDDHIALEWSNAQYERNLYMQDHLKYKTLKGDFVRSKSERFIADTLFTLGSPYRYECTMFFNDYKLNPDFVILKPNGEYLIWEHFGLLDDELYAKKTLSKLKKYQMAGYVQYKNLICTTEEDFLSKEVIEDILQRFYFS